MSAIATQRRPDTEIESLRSRIAELTRENQNLRDQIEAKDDALQDEVDRMFRLGMTRSETLILGFLVRRGQASRAALYEYVYSHASKSDVSDRSIDCFIKRIRRKLPASVEIKTIYGEGYAMDEASRNILKGAVG